MSEISRATPENAGTPSQEAISQEERLWLDAWICVSAIKSSAERLSQDESLSDDNQRHLREVAQISRELEKIIERLQQARMPD